MHTVAESITYQQGISRKTREILKVIHDIHPISVNDAEEIFSQIMELEGEKFKFKLIDCMEIVK